MTEVVDSINEATPAYDPAIEQLLERAASKDISTEVRVLGGVASSRKRVYVILDMPNGRSTRRVPVFPSGVEEFLASGFENYVILGDYMASVDTRTGLIEAMIVGVGPSSRVTRALQEIPGAEIDEITESDPDVELADDASPRATLATKWRLLVEQDGVSIELSPISDVLEGFFGGHVSIKISGVSTTTHDQALEALERYANALLFDLDLVYGIPLQVAKKRLANRPRPHQRPDRPPRFPHNQYAGQALQLYQYGRMSAGLPLLEYLAYYQSTEYFFPFFAREHTVQAVRSQLLHPRFDATNDAALNRLINLASPAGRAGLPEREQLRATVRACVDAESLREFVESTPEYIDHFCAKKQAIKGVGSLQLTGNHEDLRDQVADRIYAIRCRIVHAKQDGGGASVDVLLPSSSEASSLQADIELVRMVAQLALVARAARA